MIKGRLERNKPAGASRVALERSGQTTNSHSLGIGKQLTRAIVQGTTMATELNRSRTQQETPSASPVSGLTAYFRSEKENKTVKIGGILCCSTKKSRLFSGRISVRCSLVNLPTAGFKVLSEVTLRPKNKEEGTTRLAELQVRHRSIG